MEDGPTFFFLLSFARASCCSSQTFLGEGGRGVGRVGGWSVGSAVGGGSVHIELGAEVVQNVVRRGIETTSGGEGKVGGN
jgi:hypothetical protein